MYKTYQVIFFATLIAWENSYLQFLLSFLNHSKL